MKQYPEYFQQESERLLFRSVKKEDALAWEEFFHKNEFIPYLGIPAGMTIEEMATRWMEIQFERYKDLGFGHLAAIEKQSGELIGMGGIIPRKLDDKDHFEIVYSIIPSQWGKGYATEIAQQMQRKGLELGLATNFISIIHVENHPSMKVAEKNGMKAGGETTFLDMPVIVYRTDNDE